VNEPLERYKAKRDFGATPEPAGEQAGPAEGNRFVVQEHHARRLHWDFRLERDGVLVSWAVPKGIPPDPKVNHLAVHTEDHPLDYIDFAGEIPRGSYGAGKVSIWDHGTYEGHKWDDREVMVTLHGERVTGRYVLFRTRGDDWMMHRMDPPQDPGREPMPTGLMPMEPVDGRLPEEDGWAFEVSWGGARVLSYGEGGRVSLQGPDQADLTARFPELARIGRALGSHEVVLDGEVVVLDEAGRPSPERLASRLEAESDSVARRLAAKAPAAYVIFDLLYLDGHPIMNRPYEERRRRLEELALEGLTWRTPAAHRGEGSALLEAVGAQGLAGVVAKRLDSPYRPAMVSPDWVRTAA
jgi:bifunctional non-homologous end joining protein LigD